MKNTPAELLALYAELDRELADRYPRPFVSLDTPEPACTLMDDDDPDWVSWQEDYHA